MGPSSQGSIGLMLFLGERKLEDMEVSESERLFNSL